MADLNPTAVTRGPNCWQCRFFAISWDPRMPYACQRLGFKTHVMPAIEVLRIDGLPCQGFSPKQSTSTSVAPTLRKGDPVVSSRSDASGLWQA